MIKIAITSIPNHEFITGDHMVQHLMKRALVSGSQGGKYGLLVPGVYASLAIVVTTTNIVGHLILALARVVHGTIACDYTNLKAKVSQDLLQAKNRVFFIATLITCIFYHLFQPHKFHFKIPPSREEEQRAQALCNIIAAFVQRRRAICGPKSADHAPFSGMVVRTTPQRQRPWIINLDTHDPQIERLIRQAMCTGLLPRDMQLNGTLSINPEQLIRSLGPAFRAPGALIRFKEENSEGLSGSFEMVERSEIEQAVFRKKPDWRFVDAAKYHHFLLEFLEACKIALPTSLDQILHGPKADICKTYQDFVRELRQQAAQNNPKALEACYHRFASIRLFSYLESLLECVCEHPIPKEGLSLATFAEVFKEYNEKLDRAGGTIDLWRVWGNFKGTAGILFDPLIGSNIPYMRAVFNILGQPVRILRHGTPVDQQWGAVVTEDYKGFIKKAGEKGERILHLILESAIPGVQGESPRVRARMALQEYGNFFPLAFPMDGLFFRPGKVTHTTFRQLAGALSERIVNGDDFCLPEKLRQDQEFMEAIPKLCRNVCDIFFPGKENIESLQDHQSYLLLAYAHITFFLLRHLHIGLLEIICKDDQDRGGVMKTTLELYFLILAGKENDPESLRRVLINTLGPPALVKNQGVHHSRKKFIEYATTVFSAMSDEGKRALRNIWRLEVGDDAYQVEEVTGQGVYPTGATAGSRKEYMEFLDTCFRESEDPITIPSKRKNLVQELAAGDAFRRRDTGAFNAAAIEHQITRDLIGVPTFLVEDGRETEVKNFAQMQRFLEKYGIKGEKALAFLCCCQQGIYMDVLGELKRIFDNEALQINIVHDTDSDPNFAKLFTLEAKEGTVVLTHTFLGKIIDVQRDQVLRKISATTRVTDHRTGAHTFAWAPRR